MATDETLGRAVLELITDQSGLDEGLDAVKGKTADLKTTFADAGASLQAFGKGTTDVGKGLTIGLTAPVTAVIGGLAALALESASTADQLLTDAQAAAIILPTVLAQDVYDVAYDVLNHRLVLSFDAVADGVTVDDVLVATLSKVVAPRTVR